VSCRRRKYAEKVCTVMQKSIGSNERCQVSGFRCQKIEDREQVREEREQHTVERGKTESSNQEWVARNADT
jgi:hypothetical protein